MFRGSILIGCAAALAVDAVAVVQSDLKPGTPGTVTHGSLTIAIKDIPDDAEDYWPWESTEDFFTYSGLSTLDLVNAGIQKCSSPNKDAKVYTVSDGTNERCFVAIKSLGNTQKSPVRYTVFMFNFCLDRT